METMQRIQPVM